MKIIFFKIFSIISYMIGLFTWIFIMIPGTVRRMRFSNGGIFQILLICIAAIILSFLFASGIKFDAQKIYIINKCLSISLLLIYINFLVIILFTGRRYLGYTSINLIPLKTIIDYFNNFIHHSINTITFIENIFFNILLFMPINFLQLCLFKPLRKFSIYLTVNIGIFIIVEFMQVFLHCGIGDIDDIILELTGLLISFVVFKNLYVQRFLKKMLIFL